MTGSLTSATLTSSCSTTNQPQSGDLKNPPDLNVTLDWVPSLVVAAENLSELERQVNALMARLFLASIRTLQKECIVLKQLLQSAIKKLTQQPRFIQTVKEA